MSGGGDAPAAVSGGGVLDAGRSQRGDGRSCGRPAMGHASAVASIQEADGAASIRATA